SAASRCLTEAAGALQRNALEQEVTSGVVCADLSTPTSTSPKMSPDEVAGGLGWLAKTVLPSLVHLPARFVPFSLGVTAAQVFVDATVPLSEGDRDGVMEVGARRMFGKSVDELDHAQTAALARRYTDNPVTGIAHMISDQM